MTDNTQDRVIGHVTLYSGSLLLADSIDPTGTSMDDSQRVKYDLGRDNVRVPVLLTNYDGQNFILIPLDSATPIIKDIPATVQVSDPVPIQEDTEK